MKVCTLPNAKNYSLSGTNYCFSYLGKKAYKDGAKTCQELNAKLPLPRSTEETNKFKEILRSFNIYKLSSTNGIILDISDKDTEGFWMDSNGKEINYTNWLPGQPDNEGNQHYASICSEFNFGLWGDWSADWLGIVICQQELADQKVYEVEKAVKLTTKKHFMFPNNDSTTPISSVTKPFSFSRQESQISTTQTTKTTTSTFSMTQSSNSVNSKKACQTVKFLGKDYDGNVSVTFSGRTCQNWQSQTPHKHTRQQGGLHNYCRNPDNAPGGVWCYTVDPGKRWEYCYQIKGNFLFMNKGN